MRKIQIRCTECNKIKIGKYQGVCSECLDNTIRALKVSNTNIEERWELADDIMRQVHGYLLHTPDIGLPRDSEKALNSVYRYFRKRNKLIQETKND